MTPVVKDFQNFTLLLCLCLMRSSHNNLAVTISAVRAFQNLDPDATHLPELHTPQGPCSVKLEKITQQDSPKTHRSEFHHHEPRK